MPARTIRSPSSSKNDGSIHQSNPSGDQVGEKPNISTNPLLFGRILSSGTDLLDERYNVSEGSERLSRRKPTDNAYAESFHGSRRDDCLNTNWFLSLEEAQGKIETWRRY